MENAYHGDTVGAMSVGARGIFNAAYEPLLFEVRYAFPFHSTRRKSKKPSMRSKRFCRARKVAALLLEPLVLGAGGMLMYRCPRC